MRSNNSLPYRTVDDRSIEWAGWELFDGDSWDPVLQTVPGWDYQRSLRMRTTCQFPDDRILDESGLPDGAEVMLVVILGCRDTLCSRVLVEKRFTLHRGAESSCELEFGTERDCLSRQITVQASLLLPNDVSGVTPFVASARGSRLGTWSWAFDIEGDSSRMPMEIIDFEKRLGTRAASGARWYLDWSSRDLHLPLGRQIRLLINSRYEEFKELVSANDPVVASMLAHHVATGIICTVLEADGLSLSDHDYPEGSLGDTGVDMIRLCFPGATVGEIRNMRQHDPEKFASLIQAVYWEV